MTKKTFEKLELIILLQPILLILLRYFVDNNVISPLISLIIGLILMILMWFYLYRLKKRYFNKKSK